VPRSCCSNSRGKSRGRLLRWPARRSARIADVAEATVFNYFPTKEDLFCTGLQAFEEELLSAIRERKHGRAWNARRLHPPADRRRTRNTRLARQVRAQAERALTLLDEGLSHYAVKDRPGP